MRMRGYYDDLGPQPSLTRPLCLIGAAGCRAGTVAKSMAGLSGLPVIELDRNVETRAGKSLVEICLRHGEHAWRQVEHEELVAALRQVPPAVIALGPGALDRADSRNAVLDRADLIYLRWGLVELAAAARELIGENPGGYPELHGAPITALGLGPLLEHRERHYCDGDVVDGAGRVPWQVARELLAGLTPGN
jgi:shikimate kinase